MSVGLMLSELFRIEILHRTINTFVVVVIVFGKDAVLFYTMNCETVFGFELEVAVWTRKRLF